MEQQFKTVITANSKWINLHLKETYEYRDLIFLFVRRDFVSKYKQTILGPLWAVIQPLLTTIVFTVIFGSLANLTTLDVKATEETVIPAFLFYMAGTICWSYFSSTVSSTANTFITNSSIMGKVYLKTKYDNEMKMEIPHNHNFASAMFGFREMAAEIVPYHLIDDIYDDFKREDIALDYIDQCNVLFNKFGVTPHIPDYPDVLKPFLGRKIWKDTINSISRDENKWSAGYFVKPAVRSKAFTGKTISSIKDLMGCGNHAEDYEVLVSESLDIAAEWRCFITYDEIIDVRPYGMIIDKSRKGYLYHYDAQVLNSMMESFVSWEDRPMACSMDICVTKDGRTLLVEFNDAYSLGAYGLADIYYAKLISARWSQLLGVKDEYHF